MSSKSSNLTFEEKRVQADTGLKELFCIGRILRPHGRSGALFISLEEPDRLKHVPRSIFIEKDDAYFLFKVIRMTPHKKGALLILEDFTREQAEIVRGCRIYVEEEERLPLECDEFFIRDLMGMAVYWKKGYLGRVRDILVFHYTEMLEIETQMCRQALLIPFRKTFVHRVDLEERIIEVNFPDNWLEIYR